jgi:plasmid stabilization system protein ParE
VRVIYHRLADAEYQRTCRALGRQGLARRNRFIQAVDDAVGRIVANPAVGSPVFGAYRWVRAGRFQYLLFYRQLAADLIVIYAVAHARRRPGYWLRRANRP